MVVSSLLELEDYCPVGLQYGDDDVRPATFVAPLHRAHRRRAPAAVRLAAYR